MSDEGQKPDRRGNGTFRKGTTGNPKGRPKKNRQIPHPENIRDMQYDVAEFEMMAKINGKRVKTNLMQANLLTLAMAGAAGDKIAARVYLQYMQACVEHEQRVMDRQTKRLDGVTPSYLSETDPEKRAVLKEAWENAINEATGHRARTTRGLGVRKLRRS